MRDVSLLERIKDEMPIGMAPSYACRHGAVGLVIVDEINGFCTVGAGNLAPAVPNDQVTRMVAETARLAGQWDARSQPILAFLDTHEPGRLEPPYPPHCERGTGEEMLVAELAWLQDRGNATLIRKDCINGFIGSIEVETGANRFADWVCANRLEAVLVTGICTDICVMDFVLTTLSARNHGLLGDLRDVVVLEPATATYDLSRQAARDLQLPEETAHPRDLSHYLGLYFMASRGALLASSICWAD